MQHSSSNSNEGSRCEQQSEQSEEPRWQHLQSRRPWSNVCRVYSYIPGTHYPLPQMRQTLPQTLQYISTPFGRRPRKWPSAVIWVQSRKLSILEWSTYVCSWTCSPASYNLFTSVVTKQPRDGFSFWQTTMKTESLFRIPVDPGGSVLLPDSTLSISL
jgi:hypothetical protein